MKTTVHFNLTWIIITLVVIGNIVLFYYLSRNVKAYISDIDETRHESYYDLYYEQTQKHTQ